jgi:hypothetical protein
MTLLDNKTKINNNDEITSAVLANNVLGILFIMAIKTTPE